MSRKKQEYIVKEGSFHEKFWHSRLKIQFIGGAFANGKTTAVVMKTLDIAKNYPGIAILMARATEPKLRTTLLREFFKWCPTSWIKSYSKTNLEVELVNGTRIDFRYIRQKVTESGDSTSNLLSANYGLIVVDQIEDPEITEKDVDDLMGRLRDDAPYEGDDPTMPQDGPRWMFLTANPTGNWVYHKFIKPIYDMRKGFKTPELICDERDGTVLIELFEGSTYDNAHNLKEDYIRALEATYRGQMRDRYLLGQWVSYEGLVYPMFNDKMHFINHTEMVGYLQRLRETRYTMSFVEAYDHGLHSPSCYLLGFADDQGVISWIDGFYEPEHSIHQSAMKIKTIRMIHGVPTDHDIYADPDIFRRKGTSNTRTVGRSVASMFEEDEGIKSMRRANNSMISGIAQVASYLSPQKHVKNPYTSDYNSPMMYFSTRLEFVRREITGYMWKRQKSTGEIVDQPIDKNDHAMDTLKYGLTSRPKVSEVMMPDPYAVFPNAFLWHVNERKKDNEKDTRRFRHG